MPVTTSFAFVTVLGRAVEVLGAESIINPIQVVNNTNNIRRMKKMNRNSIVVI